jgi:outer membrane protein assembly factor BamD (BamD/ComL family)
MGYCMRSFVALVLSMPLLIPVAVAQKPPAPAPSPSPPTSTPPSHSGNPPPPSSQPIQPTGDLVMFLRGHVATNDGTPVPSDVLVERVCDNQVHQQLYASLRGDFSMQLGSRTDSFVDASGDPTSQSALAGKNSSMGIPRSNLRRCELRASTSGFRDGVISLVSLDTSGSNVDVGVIVVQRAAKIEGMTLSATPYRAPKDARKAYEKGLDAEKHGKLPNARKYFENAVEIYPTYVNAWFQLGTVLEKDNQKDAARAAYTRATTIDNRFLPPYLSLASMAFQAENWTEVLSLTAHIFDLDPLNRSAVTGYVVDSDPFNCADAYFYNALANYKLNNIAEAEKSALKAEHMAMLNAFPQLHLLLAEIFARKDDYTTAISELQIYLQLVPNAKNVEQVRVQLARLQKLNDSASPTKNPDPM